MTDALPPRLEHNRTLATEFFEENPVPRYLRVTDQLPTVAFDKGKLFPNGYNASILEYKGELLMAYRYPRQDIMATHLALAVFDLNGACLSNRTLLEGATGTLDDPRLFMRGGVPWVCWIDSTYPADKIICVVKYAPLENLAAAQQVRPPIPGEIEKNHLPLVLPDGMYFIYRSYPEQIVLKETPSGPFQAVASNGFRWPWGEPRGGTPPLPYEGKLLRFFHSSRDSEPKPYFRRYFVGAAIMNSTPPYETIAVSKRPIVYGSELPEAPLGKHHFKAQVAICFGAIARDKEWWVSLGINDSGIEIVRVKPENLNL